MLPALIFLPFVLILVSVAVYRVQTLIAERAKISSPTKSRDPLDEAFEQSYASESSKIASRSRSASPEVQRPSGPACIAFRGGVHVEARGLEFFTRHAACTTEPSKGAHPLISSSSITLVHSATSSWVGER